jgi:hypothetical protein
MDNATVLSFRVFNWSALHYSKNNRNLKFTGELEFERINNPVPCKAKKLYQQVRPPSIDSIAPFI